MKAVLEKDQYFLKSSIRLEPHVWGWYAWPQLIAPTTAGFNILHRNLKLMESFTSMPEIHKMAATNRTLMGGSFVNLEQTFVPEVQRLIDDTKENCKELITLSHAITECDEMLRSNADGHSLESLYALVPNALKGTVELVYDANNHPSIRFIEPLLYEKYYNNSRQTIVLTDTTEDYRPFVLSTPRMIADNEIKLDLPFADSRIDTLAQLRFNSLPENEIYKLLNIETEEKKHTLKKMLTAAAPNLDETRNFQGSGLRVRYFGHACVLLETKNTKILIDPVVSYQYQTEIERYTLNDLPDKIDYVLFTHIHDDHVMFETLLQMRYKVKNFVFPSNNKGFLMDPSLKLILQKCGFKNLMTLEEFESVEFNNGYITGVPFLGEHSDLNVQTKMAYFIKMHNTTFLFAADSNNLENELYKHVFAKLGKADVLFIGMECVGAPLTWLYGPLLTYKISKSHNSSRRLSGSNFEKAREIVNAGQSSHVYVYAMGKEPWLNYIMALDYHDKSVQTAESDKLVEYCKTQDIISERLFLKKEWHFS